MYLFYQCFVVRLFLIMFLTMMVFHLMLLIYYFLKQICVFYIGIGCTVRNNILSNINSIISKYKRKRSNLCCYCVFNKNKN